MAKGTIYKGINLVIVVVGIVFILPILPSNAKAIVIALFGISALALVVQRKWSFNRNFFITNALVYFVVLVTFFYSENTDYALKKLSTMASLLVFPFIFAMLNKDEIKAIQKKIHVYLSIYLIAVFLFNVGAFAWIFALRPHYTMAEAIQHFTTLLDQHMGKWSVHPIYMSMHCSIAVLFSFYIIQRIKSKALIASILAIDITLVLFLLLYAKKGPLMALIIVFSLFVAFQRRKKLLKPYLIGIISLTVLVIAIPKTRNKFVELFEIETIDKGNLTSTNIRYTIYNISKDLISNAIFTGYGIGDYNDQLIQQYEKEGRPELVEGKYNAHNQYISFVIIGGILCLLALLFTMSVNLIYAIRFDNQILILMLIFYGVVMFTENILEREDGAIYFAFFLNFFALFNYEKEKV
jgi:O-antigen ligase